MRCADSEERGRARDEEDEVGTTNYFLPLKNVASRSPPWLARHGWKEDFLLQSDSQRCTRDMYDPADRQEDFIGVKGVPITVQIGPSWICRNLPTTEWIRGSTAYQTDVYHGKNASLHLSFSEGAPCGDGSNSSKTTG